MLSSARLTLRLHLQATPYPASPSLVTYAPSVLETSFALMSIFQFLLLAASVLQFAFWMKKNVIAGRPVIGGFRVSGGGYEDYDHIM